MCTIGSGIALDCLEWLTCAVLSILRACGYQIADPCASPAARYSSLVHRVHTPILMVGLVAVLGVWHDSARLAFAIAAVFGLVILFLLADLLDRSPRQSQTLQPRHDLVAHCRATESSSPTPLEWRCAMSRSGGAPPPAYERLASGQLTRRLADAGYSASAASCLLSIPTSLSGGF